MYGYDGWIYYDTCIHVTHTCKENHPPVITPIQAECTPKTVYTDTRKNPRIVSVSTRAGRNDFVIYHIAVTMILLALLHHTLVFGSNRRTRETLRKQHRRAFVLCKKVTEKNRRKPNTV